MQVWGWNFQAVFRLCSKRTWNITLSLHMYLLYCWVLLACAEEYNRSFKCPLVYSSFFIRWTLMSWFQDQIGVVSLGSYHFSFLHFLLQLFKAVLWCGQFYSINWDVMVPEITTKNLYLIQEKIGFIIFFFSLFSNNTHTLMARPVFWLWRKCHLLF